MPIPLDELDKRNAGVYRAAVADAPEPKSGWMDELGAAVDSTQAGLYGIGEAAGKAAGWEGLERAAGRQRISNQVQSEQERQYADQQLGIASSWDEAKGLGGVGKYVAGQVVNMAPQLAVTAGAGLLTGGLGAGAAAYGFALSDTLQNQREQAGTTDMLSAGAAAVPYAAVDVATGGEGRMLRGLGVKGLGTEARASHNLLERVEKGADKITGAKGYGARAGLEFAKTGAEEAAGETFQETMNQAARMGVDPSVTMTDPDALERYKESAIVGGLIGGGTGAGMNLGRRSKPVGGPQTGESQIGANADPGASLTQTTPVVAGSKAAGLTPPADPARTGGEGAVLKPQIDAALGEAMPVAANAAAEAKKAEAPPPTPQEQAETQRVAAIKDKLDASKSITDQAVSYGVDPKHLTEFASLKAALDEGEIDEDTFTSSVAALASGNPSLISQVKSAIAEVDKGYAAKQQAKAAKEAEAAAAPAPEPALGIKAITDFRKPDGKPLSELEKDRLFLMLGLDEDGKPTGERLYPKDVALIESRTTGKKSSKQAVGDPLSKLGFGKDTINRLYEQIHGVAPAEESDTGLEDVATDEGETVRDAAHRERVTDSDQSEMQGALGAQDVGESGHMRITSSANAGVAVEDEAGLRKRRKEALQALAKAPEYTDEQRAAINNALATGADVQSAEGKAARDALINNKLFSEEQQGAIEQLLAHGKTLRAMEARQARVEELVKRRTGAQTEHEKQVRMRQAAENLAREEREEQARLEKKAKEEDLFDEGEEAIEGDARTLRMHLTDPNKARQARLIGDSLSDAKITWAVFALKNSGKPETALPAWDELTPVEQAAFVRTVDWQTHESKAGEDAETAIEAKTQELADTTQKRKNEASERAKREAEKAKPEFKEKLIAQETGAVKQTIEEGAKAAAERKAKVAERKAAKKEKPDGKQSTQGEDSKPAVVGGTDEAQGQQGAGGRVGEPDGQEVQRGRSGETAGEVPEVRAADTADATAGEAHGPGPVRGEDGQAAPEPGADEDTDGDGVAAGDGGDVKVWTGGPAGDIAGSEKMESMLQSVAQDEPIEGGIELHNGRWVDRDSAITAAQHGMSPREQAMPYQYYRILGISPNHWDEMVAQMKEENEASQLENVERLNAAREDSPAPLTVTASAGTQVEGGVARTPSVTRVVRKARSGLEAGTLSPDAFAAQASAALDAADAAREAKPPALRLRGADRVMEQLLAARRRGDLDAEGVEMALWLVRQNPAAVADLGLSVRARTKEEGGSSGFYNPVSRIVTLLKGSINSETAVHEILHHLERMMPRVVQNAIRREWTKQLARAWKDAQGNPKLSEYYNALMDYHFGEGDPKVLERALDMLHSGEVDYDHYHLFNPSEFWAVNGSRIVAGRFGVQASVLGRIRQFLREFVQKARAVLGMQSDNAVIRALNSLANADGNFTTGAMLQDQPGVHFMYAGEKTRDQEQLDMLQKYGWMKSGGSTAAELRAATGWFRSPIDNNLRYEFSDHKARFKMAPSQMKAATAREEATTYKLGDVLDHPALYAAYPDARDITVTRQAARNDLMREIQGWNSPDKNSVNITPYAKDPLSILVHELQHWVQMKEGFAVGGSPEEVAKAMSPEQRERLRDRVLNEVKDRHEEQQRAVAFMERLQNWPGLPKLMDAATREDREFRVLRNQMAKELTGKSYAAMDIESAALLDAYTSDQDTGWMQKQLAYLKARVDERQTNMDAVMAGDNPEALGRLGAGTDALLRAYKHLAGEIEARDTQARQTLTEAGRKDTKPYSNAVAEEIDFDDIVRVTQPAPAPAAVQKAQEQRLHNVERVRKEAVARVPKQAQQTVDTMSRWLINNSKNLVKGLTFTRDLIAMAAKGLPSATKYLQLEEMRNATKIRHLHDSDLIVSMSKKLGVPDRAAVNAYLKRSTMEGKWGYRPDHFSPEDRAKVKPDPAMEIAFNALKPEAQAVVKAVFEHGAKTLATMKTLVNLNVAEEFQSAIADAKARGDDKAAAKLEEDRDDQLAHFKTLLSIGEFNPYAPLKRFGNHVVVGKSQAYLDAEQALQDNPNDKDAAKAFRAMQADPAHYFVAMRETQHEAQQLRDQIAPQYQEADTMEKDRGYLNEVGGNRGMLGMFHRLRGQAEREGDALNGKAKAATDRMMTDLYLSLLSETSARQSERERRNVAGAEDDMMRAFHSKSQADANFLASLATGGAMQDTLSEMERDASRSGNWNGVPREQRQAHYKEILSRHIMSMDYKQSPAVNAALRASSVMQLLTSPAYHLTNMLQPYVMSAPTLAGRFGMVRSMAAVAAAHKQLGASMFKNGVDHSSIEDMPSDVRDGIRALMNKGLINMTLESEHGKNWNESRIDKILAPLDKLTNRIEAVNRVATGVAALRLAKGAGMSEEAATAYAAKIIYDTHGDYSGFNTPSIMRSPIARLVTQYRKFQLIQIANYTRMARDAFFNADLSKEEKWVARKALAYNLSTMFALGGTLALPGAQAIGAILGAVFGDPDEPKDPETTMRKYLADVGLEGVSDMIVKGVPAWMGVDVSGRFGAGNILSLFPYADTSEGLVSRKAFESYALAATGPFIGGVAPKLADGVSKMYHGDFYKGVENFTPNGLGNILKGARFATQGVTDSKGNTMMDADQVSFLAALGQATGFPTTTITERSQRAQSLRTMDLFYKGKVSEIKRSYVDAYRSGDAEGLAQARADFADMQARMKAHDLQPPKVSDLVKAPHAQAKKDKALVEGVATTKRTAGAARQLATIYD